MIDGEIKVGDCVFDLVNTSKMQVVEKVADSVKEHREATDFDLATYKSHPLFGVTDDDAVWKCVYLKNEVGSPSGSYDFPSSRLARIPVEEANEDVDRIQETIITDVLESLFKRAGNDGDDAIKVLERYAIDAGIETELVELARELVEVDGTIGGDPDET